MSKLFYRYGTMNSSKSANLLMVAHNYESQGRKVLCLKPSLDTRIMDEKNIGFSVIESRAVPEAHSCELINTDLDLFKFIKQYNATLLLKHAKGLSAVLVDEAQFLTSKQVQELADVVEKLDIDVICFGLKNSFVRGKLFDGSAALFYYADSLSEIETPCKFCDKKATMNLRIVNGCAIYSGETISIGDIDNGENNSDVYAQVCYHHYLNPPAPIIKETAKSIGTKSLNEYLNHILNYNNEKGIYKRYSSLKKEDLISVDIFNAFDTNNLINLRYIVIGTIAISMEDFCSYKENSSINRVNGTAVTKAIIDFVYHFYETDLNRAFQILKDSDTSNIEFFENFSEYMQFLDKGAKESKCHKLPDGKYYYLDFHTNSISQFWINVLSYFMDMGLEIKYIFGGVTA